MDSDLPSIKDQMRMLENVPPEDLPKFDDPLPRPPDPTEGASATSGAAPTSPASDPAAPPAVGSSEGGGNATLTDIDDKLQRILDKLDDLPEQMFQAFTSS